MSWTNGTKDAASWSNQSLDASAWTTQPQTKENQFLLMETGSFLLLESAFKIILETTLLPVWANQTQH